MASRAELLPRWQAHTRGSTADIDHAAWDRFLARHVVRGEDGVARVTYAAAKGPDEAALAAYVAMLEAVDVDALDRPAQYCFWANLYNARTVLLILERWPVASIRDIAISPGLFSIGPWGRALMRVKGEALSLNDVEHRILRPIWNDPRTHYALNCASFSCPDLKETAWRVATLEADLDAAARAYIDHPRGVAVSANGRVTVSSIFTWYREDFGGSDATLIAHLARHAEPAIAAALRARGRIDSNTYDWSLNGA